MPTGYTADIEEGVLFETFVLRCARNFGALIMMRDDPRDAPIPDKFEPSIYCKESLEKAKARLAELRAMSVEDADLAAQGEYDEEVARRQKVAREKAELREKYEDMLAQVRAWTPPTEDHEGLKKFMIEQITSSIDFDCEMFPKSAPPLQAGKEWLAERIQDAIEDVPRYEARWEEEVARAEGRTRWVRQLKKSLGLLPKE